MNKKIYFPIIILVILSFGLVPRVYANLYDDLPTPEPVVQSTVPELVETANVNLPVLPKLEPIKGSKREPVFQPIFYFLGSQDLSSGNVIFGTSILFTLILLFLLLLLFFARRRKEEEEKYTLSSKYSRSKFYSGAKPNPETPLIPAHTET